MVKPYYQIGWSDSHHRDIRAEVHGSMSAPIIRLVRYQESGDQTYINLLLGEAARLYNAIGQILNYQCQTEKKYAEPDKSGWSYISAEDPEDDSLGSD